jgi:hypothetical protein
MFPGKVCDFCDEPATMGESIWGRAPSMFCEKCYTSLQAPPKPPVCKGEEEKHLTHEKISKLKGQLEDFKVDRQERDKDFIRRFLCLLSIPDWTRFKNPSCPITRMQGLLNEWKSYRDDEAETEQLILGKLYALE